MKTVLVIAVWGLCGMALCCHAQEGFMPDTQQGKGVQGQRGDTGAKKVEQNAYQRVMAHHRNLLNSASLLRQELSRNGKLEKGPAARAVEQMMQSLAQMQKHHGEHKEALARGANGGNAEMMQAMDAGMARAGKHLQALEKELNTYAPDAKRLQLELDGLVRQCEMMQKEWRKKKAMGR